MPTSCWPVKDTVRPFVLPVREPPRTKSLGPGFAPGVQLNGTPPGILGLQSAYAAGAAKAMTRNTRYRNIIHVTVKRRFPDESVIMLSLLSLSGVACNAPVITTVVPAVVVRCICPTTPRFVMAVTKVCAVSMLGTVIAAAVNALFSVPSGGCFPRICWKYGTPRDVSYQSSP